MVRWRARHATKLLFDVPGVDDSITIPAGGIVLTEEFSEFSQKTWLRIEILPGYLWVYTDQFIRDFERLD